jgi:hypothetical protein
VVILTVLGFLYRRHHRTPILPAYGHRKSRLQVRNKTGRYFNANIILYSSIAQAQLLNIPAAIFSCILTIVFGIFANTGRIPQPLIPLGFMIVILSCYAVLYTFPNTGGVYAATMIAGGFSTAWYTMMWPWRVQTTEGATGSAFAIAFANSYGQIGGAVGSQLFNARYAPRYATSFGIAMAFIGMVSDIRSARDFLVPADSRTNRMRSACTRETSMCLGSKRTPFLIMNYVPSDKST